MNGESVLTLLKYKKANKLLLCMVFFLCLQRIVRIIKCSLYSPDTPPISSTYTVFSLYMAQLHNRIRTPQHNTLAAPKNKTKQHNKIPAQHITAQYPYHNI